MSAQASRLQARTIAMWVPVILLLILPGTFVLLPAAAWAWKKWRGTPAVPPVAPPPTASGTAASGG